MSGARALAWNLRELSRVECGPGVSDGIALQTTGGRRVLWVPRGRELLGIDVSDPRTPAVIASIDGEATSITGASVHETMLAVASIAARSDTASAGLTLYDLANPTAPRVIGVLDLAGDGSRGASAVCIDGNGRAHLAAGVPGRAPGDPRDDMAYVVVDVATPASPHVLSQWSVPAGRRVDPRFDTGRSVQSARVFPTRPDRAYVACGDAGLAVLDITAPEHPRPLVQWSHSPPYHGGTHAVAPLLAQGYALVADQPVADAAADWPKRVWMVDLRAETKAMPVGMLPAPPLDAFRARPGRLGAYDVRAAGDLAFVAFGSGGVRVIDVADPYATAEIGYFVPGEGEVTAVLADDRDVVYAIDRRAGALYSLALDL